VIRVRIERFDHTGAGFGDAGAGLELGFQGRGYPRQALVVQAVADNVKEAGRIQEFGDEVVSVVSGTAPPNRSSRKRSSRSPPSADSPREACAADRSRPGPGRLERGEIAQIPNRVLVPDENAPFTQDVGAKSLVILGSKN